MGQVSLRLYVAFSCTFREPLGSYRVMNACPLHNPLPRLQLSVQDYNTSYHSHMSLCRAMQRQSADAKATQGQLAEKALQ